MRAYFAVLKDSFREAVASRILLIALAAIVVVLLLLSPFTLRYEQATELRRSELVRPERVLEELKAGADQTDSPQAHLWSLLTDEQKSAVNRLLNPDPGQPNQGGGGPRGNPVERELVRNLNELIRHEQLYSKESWANVELPEEARQLIASDSLTEAETRRRNLLLIIAAFPRSIRVTDNQAISLLYGTAVIIESIPLTPTQFQPVFERILVAVITVFLGFLGIFASLLVTAGMIPRTFETGEIALLLSKPVNRSLLFVTKFIGGCTFTLLYASVLVVGIYILLGVRMNFWRPELLWCIPVYVFLFMIYFSISAVAGAIWRNSIVALALVVVFWLTITVVGATKQAIEDNIVQSRGIKEIIPAGQHILTVDGDQNTYAWNQVTQVWDEVFQVPAGQGLGGFARRFLISGVRFAPVFDAANNRILVLQQSESRFRGFGPPELVAGYADDDWERTSLGRLPDVASAILMTNDGRIIVPTTSSLNEYVPDSQAQPNTGGGLLGALTGGLLGGGSKSFRTLNSQDYPSPGNNFSSALNLTNNAIVLYDNGRLDLLTADERDQYSISTSREFETQQTGVVAVAGNYALLGLADGRLLILNAITLETVIEIRLPEGVLPRVCCASPDGRYLAALTHAGTVFLFDAEDGTQIAWTPPESGQCSAVAFAPNGELLVSNGRLAVRQYDINNQTQTHQWAQQPPWVHQFFDLFVFPLWTILPKPSELDEFVPYVMTGESTILVNEAKGPPGMIDRDSLQQQRTTFDAQRVIRDNALFIIIILGIGCIIIARRDF